MNDDGADDDAVTRDRVAACPGADRRAGAVARVVYSDSGENPSADASAPPSPGVGPSGAAASRETTSASLASAAESPRRPLAGDDGDFWVFGYGSLMWRPGFPHGERVLAAVGGYHRALCVYSHVHRGTPARPGLVLGLDRGGSCRGVAFRVSADDAEATIRYLREREQVTSVYLERYLDARLADGRRVRAVAYVVDRAHGQYAGRLDHDDTLRIVRGGVGLSGENPDYVVSTHAHLVEIGVRDSHLARLAAALSFGAATTDRPSETGPRETPHDTAPDETSATETPPAPVDVTTRSIGRSG